ncbi:MAG: hypothetical protein AAFQ82_08995 [Myxococcota bacterium]
MARWSTLLALSWVLACGSNDVDAPILDDDPLADQNSNSNGNNNNAPQCDAVESGCFDGADNDCDGALDCADSDCASDSVCQNPSADSDSDGLPNDWELAAGDLTLLDPMNADSDGNGVDDGDEDYDFDGLSTLEEFALTRLSAATLGQPHPLRIDLIVEFDQMVGKAVSDAIVQEAATAFAAADIANVDGTRGVGLHVYRDQIDIPVQSFTQDFGPRNAALSTHGPRFGDSDDPPIPYDQMVHVIVASERSDIPGRGGEVVSGPTREAAGVFIYFDSIVDTFPVCIDPTLGTDAALANTLAHELGHTLQLGHDTEVGGGVNNYNIMSLVSDCESGQRRFFGVGNTDPALGNTESVAAPRFSAAATLLMDFQDRLSVDTGDINDTEM